jgi:hypothetical protein
MDHKKEDGEEGKKGAGGAKDEKTKKKGCWDHSSQ